VRARAARSLRARGGRHPRRSERSGHLLRVVFVHLAAPGEDEVTLHVLWAHAKSGFRRSNVVDGSSGMTRVAPTTLMKFVSPLQRGTRCRCRWPTMPAPALSPRFMPRLIPCAR